jgi:hypothetical protein
VRWLLKWQAVEYDKRIWCGIVPLIGLQPGVIVLFTSYALARLALLASSFLMLLKNYDLQLLHLTPLLWDVCGRAVIGVPVLALLSVVSLREEPKPPGAYYF